MIPRKWVHSTKIKQNLAGFKKEKALRLSVRNNSATPCDWSLTTVLVNRNIPVSIVPSLASNLLIREEILLVLALVEDSLGVVGDLEAGVTKVVIVLRQHCQSFSFGTLTIRVIRCCRSKYRYPKSKKPEHSCARWLRMLCGEGKSAISSRKAVRVLGTYKDPRRR